MRWEVLFEDLQSQLEAAERQEADDAARELAEAEAGQVLLADRVRARHGKGVSVRLRDGQEVTGTVLDAAPQWLLLGQGDRRTLVPAEALVLVWPLGPAAPPAGHVERRLRVTHALREIARQGARVRLVTSAGELTGWILRVGADHLDVQSDDPSPGRVVSVTLGALLAVRTG